MVKHREDIEKQQRLYEILKEQHEAEKHEIVHYSSILKDIENSLIRNYITTLLNDGIKHIQYITQAMTKIEGASGSLHLTKEGLNKSIKEEEESKNLVQECINLTEDPDIKELLKSIVVDEDHHIKILQHISQIVETYSKKIKQ
ncbi:MAG TPA: ferritin-like domain-containing protein [Nitrososphaeraceae archaeon]|nr:ferritin-like domain-containing protein [Nitrososphaeraceae archaeon]